MYTVQFMQGVTFNFGPTTQSTVTASASIQVPPGTNVVMAYLQGFDLSYTNNQEFGFGELQVFLNAVSTQQIQATVTLRDNNVNKRSWSGSVNAWIVAYQGSNAAVEGNGEAGAAESVSISHAVGAGS